MKLPPRNHDEYRTHGWTVVEKIFTAHDVDAVGQLALNLCEEELEPDESNYAVDRSEDGRIAPRKLDHGFLKHGKLRAFVMAHQLRSLIEQLIGKPPLLFFDQIHMKPPQFGSAKPYHQDNAYFLCQPDDQVITAWIALDDVDETNGCLRYIDGSHLGPVLNHQLAEGSIHHLQPMAEQIDLSRERLALVKKGGVVFHHSKALHASHRNYSDRWRRGYATHWATAKVTSKNDTIQNAYYNRHPGLYQEALDAVQ